MLFTTTSIILMITLRRPVGCCLSLLHIAIQYFFFFGSFFNFFLHSSPFDQHSRVLVLGAHMWILLDYNPYSPLENSWLDILPGLFLLLLPLFECIAQSGLASLDPNVAVDFLFALVNSSKDTSPSSIRTTCHVDVYQMVRITCA